jgi:hypothetical protein
MGLDLPHGMMIVNFLMAIHTFIKFKGGNRVGFSLIFAPPIAPHFPDIAAAA